MDTDRNLLFGVVALQVDAVTRSQFIEACSSWATRKDVPLADVFVERGWLSAEDRGDVERLVQRKLARHHGDAKASLAEAGAGPLPSLAAVPDADVRASLLGLAGAGSGALGTTVAYQPESRNRYTLSHLHATGGLGRVWLARDADLGRDVALKEIRPERQGQPAVVARFLEEAKITGQLEHPGIIPVYELICQADSGQPVYTMRFLKGRTLTDAVQSYHRQRAAGLAGPLELREFLTAFVAVCKTVAYAHSRGVIHRDLKPQNIILGDFGEVMVLDWGLAKLVDRADDSSRLPVEVEDSGRGETLQGQVLGTPAYMAPEQADGRQDRVNSLSDVYSLGAILYELLTAQPPFPGGDTQSVLDRVKHEPPVPPRALVPQAPPALEAICLKALAKAPADRFASARALGTEMEHFLADEPVSVYAEPLPARLARWGRRHKAAAAAAAALLATAVVALSIGTVLLTQANRGTQAERDRAERNFHEAQQQRDLARENFLTARRAVDTYLTQVSEEHLLNEPGQQPLRRKLLQSALEYYQAFLRQQRDDPQLRKELADAHRRLGTILSDLSEPGSLGDAEKALQEAVRLFEQLRTVAPADQEVRASLARAYKTLAELHALTLLHLTAAEAEARHVITLAGELRREQPHTPEFGALLGRGHDLLGISRARQGDFPAAEKAQQEAIAVLEKLTRDAPHHVEGWQLLGTTYSNLAYLYHTMGRPTAGQHALKQPIAVNRRLLQDNPRNAIYRRDLTRGLANLATMEQEAGRYRTADQACSEGLPMLLQLVADSPTGYRSQNYLSEMYIITASLKQVRGQLGFAIADFRKAVALAEEVRHKNPDEKDMLLYIARGLHGLGLVAWRRGDFQAALRSYGRAKAEWEAYLAVENNVFTQRLFLTFRAEWLALEVDAGKKTAAEQLGPQAALVAEWEQLKKADPSPVNQAGLAASHAQLAAGEAQAGDPAQALRSLDRALVLLKEATDRQPDDCIFRQMLARAHAVRARLLAKDNVTAAVPSARQAVDLVEKLAVDEIAYLYDLACHRALLSSLLDPKSAEAERRAASAVAALGEAVARGYDNVHSLRTDPSLAPLRPRSDFRKTLERAEGNAENHRR